MASTPEKAKKTEARTAQTGDMPGLDYVGKEYITPRKKLNQGETEDDDYDAENVRSVDIPALGPEAAEVGARQEEFNRALLAARTKKNGGKKKRRSTKKTKKVKKVKKHRKQK